MKVLLIAISLFVAITCLAQHKFLDMNAPGAKKHMKTQVERMELIKAHKLSGVLGESDTAMLMLHSTEGLKPAQIKRAKDLMAAENIDRKGIFDAITKHNKLNEKEKKLLIRSAYETYRNMDAKGTYYFEKESWHKKY